MNIIYPIKIEDIYHFDFEITNNPVFVFPIMDLLKKDISLELLKKFIKRNNDNKSLSLLLSLIPFSKVIEWYYENQIMRCYWSEQLIARLYNICYQKLIIKFYNGDYYENELINLTGKFNTSFNFTTGVINRRLSLLRGKYMVNLCDFYGGTRCVELLGSDKLFKKVYNGEIIYKVRLYPKICKISKEYNETKFNPNLIIEDKNIIIEIILEQFNNIGSVIIDFNEDALIEFHETYANIVCRPPYYNNLSNNIHDDLNISYILSAVSIGLSKITLKRCGSIKLKKHECSLKEITLCESIGKCYMCKKYYDKTFVVDTYIDMCLECGRFNYEKREMVADLTNVRALVTGIRVKIGYATALKLLRCGAKVIGTTRYPGTALMNFRSEHDYEKYKDNLTIIKCNFLNLKEVYRMLDIVDKYNVNIIINNACQTVRQSNSYIKRIRLLENEVNKQFKLLQYETGTNLSELTRSMIQYMPNIEINQFNDIKDMKDIISWDQEIDKIDPGEIVEAVLINQLVPMLIINRLKREMNKILGPKFIINVTALEGQFNYHKKNNKHLHTNMCKAAMNMMIRTLAEDPDPNLHVYCIDPGYVSGVCPQLDHYPVSMHDGASRIVYPILKYYNGDPVPKKCIKLRNYEPADW